jgi:hypothetical protein
MVRFEDGPPLGRPEAWAGTASVRFSSVRRRLGARRSRWLPPAAAWPVLADLDGRFALEREFLVVHYELVHACRVVGGEPLGTTRSF